PRASSSPTSRTPRCCAIHAASTPSLRRTLRPFATTTAADDRLPAGRPGLALDESSGRHQPPSSFRAPINRPDHFARGRRLGRPAEGFLHFAFGEARTRNEPHPGGGLAQAAG